MELKNYYLVIINDNGVQDGYQDGYVELAHNTQYQLYLTNSNRSRCDVAVHIDGKHVGTWRIDACKHIFIERPANDTGKFTFYRYGTAEANVAGLKKNELLGLVTAIFKPEKVDELISSSDTEISDFAFTTKCAGGTGLSGESKQKFKGVEALDYDLDKQVTIHLRLIAKDVNIRRLRPISTLIPPPM